MNALESQGLVELVGWEDRAELSVLEGRPVRWSGRLTPYGHDLRLRLAEQVRAASCDHGIKRWQRYLTQEQMEPVAYGLWLHRMTGAAAEANRLAREYGVAHSPAPGLDVR
ncbi:DUF6417 family protein [Streptomyces sp. NPDC007896]|uniref:DUF6417 family protein n=1 Tax=Streptomyces sp. NPDC007896 TaxID=3364784 RepID=UPI0036E0EEA6